MTCIMWLAARPPCSSGQPRVSHLRSASFPWNERRKSQRSSPASPSAPAPPQSAGSARRPGARTSLRAPPPSRARGPLRAPPLPSFFPPRDLSAFRLDPTRLRTLIATGDVIPARHTDVVIRPRGDGLLSTGAGAEEVTAGGAPTVVNPEPPLVGG